MTANDDFLDAMIRHQIFLMRLSGKVRNDIIKLLNATERDMADEIRRRLRQGSGQGLTPANIKRMEALIKVLRTMRAEAWTQAEKVWVDEMRALAASEPAFMDQILKTVSPVQLVTELPDQRLLKSLVTSRPFEGRTLRSWASSVRASDITRISDQIRIGMVQGDTNAQIARRVVGTVRNRGRDGVTQITRRNAEAITRTAVNHFANQARSEFYQANSDLFTEEQYVATLDAATTPVCRANDGKRFKVGEGPIPPLHYGCRSLRVAVINDKVLGNRPMKPVTERRLLEEYSREIGIPTVTSRGALPRGTRGAFDEFSRRRTRQLVGKVPADVDYGTFLRRQSADFQNDVMGNTKARLFRDGNLQLDKFVSRTGDELSLAQLARREADAFRSAGLDPEDFL